MTLNDLATPLSHLATRRSGKPRDLAAPGPDAAALREMIAIAARTPDHGKLSPWRFVIVPPERRAALAETILAAHRAERPEAADAERAKLEQFAHQAPALIVVMSSLKPSSSIPVWEQELSVGAATMNLLHAAHAMGFAAGWLTGWPAFSPGVRDAFGNGDERIAGFVFIGTPSRPLDERPRPDLDAVVSLW